ncbi:hypothetical protein SKL01_18410 [Staphylococcus kloosii]|uniref:Uncharacterized protein n=1 Tax=Staphylococcus kloosii TaxID=29384 RepID=A0ABQ0XP60_9STAP|nr:hypothetical protein SKL01_18410 [Staphylococcus kloosii]
MNRNAVIAFSILSFSIKYGRIFKVKLYLPYVNNYYKQKLYFVILIINMIDTIINCFKII